MPTFRPVTEAQSTESERQTAGRVPSDVIDCVRGATGRPRRLHSITDPIASEQIDSDPPTTPSYIDFPIE